MSILNRFDLFREGGNVRRFHTKNLLKSQDNAQHSFNCALIVNEFAAHFDDVDPHKVVMAMLLHDVPEAGIGDSPHDTKMYNPAIKEALDIAEENWVAKNLPSYNRYFHDLNKNEQYICSLADQFEALLKSIEELAMGNRQMEVCVTYIYYHICELVQTDNTKFSQVVNSLLSSIRYQLQNKYDFSV